MAKKKKEKVYKLVNGKRVEVKAAELKALEAEWAKNKADVAAEELHLAEKKAVRKSALAKLKKLGLSKDELVELFGE